MNAQAYLVFKADFIGGPADGKRLGLRRFPYLLRVSDQLRTLENLADTPKPGEQLVVYQKIEDTGWFAKYRVAEEQPSRPILLGTNAWREWCFEQVEAGKVQG